MNFLYQIGVGDDETGDQNIHFVIATDAEAKILVGLEAKNGGRGENAVICEKLVSVCEGYRAHRVNTYEQILDLMRSLGYVDIPQ